MKFQGIAQPFIVDAVAAAKESYKQNGELISSVYALTTTQRLVLRLLINRAVPLPTGTIRLGIVTHLYWVNALKGPTYDIRSEWVNASYEEAANQLDYLRKLGIKKEIPSFNGLQTQLEALEEKGFIFKVSTLVKVSGKTEPKKSQRALSLWAPNPQFVNDYFEIKKKMLKNNDTRTAYPYAIISFFEADASVPEDDD